MYNPVLYLDLLTSIFCIFSQIQGTVKDSSKDDQLRLPEGSQGKNGWQKSYKLGGVTRKKERICGKNQKGKQ